MTSLLSRPGVVEVIAKAYEDDPGAGHLVAEWVVYEALCDEIERIAPFAERDLKAVMVAKAHGALERIAKAYRTATTEERAELEELAEQLTAVVEFGKADAGGTPDNKATPYWDARDASGRFRSMAFNLLNAATQRDEGMERKASDVADALQGDRYSRMKTLGRGLSQLSGGGSPVGTMMTLAGDIGPEAERVFGRPLQRMAYRYRGTERRPSPELQAAMALQLDADSRRERPTGESPDSRRMAVLGHQGAKYLLPQVPDMELARLSLEAGQMPPSRGLIVDADGRVVSEAQGFNGDHYLPFDLKNLKRLRGGQYIRTRTTGGLTDEDIYTGVLSGARQIQVVSNSGVFTLEFDPSLRGGRRYSDKARQMVRRYAALTKTIGSGKTASGEGLYAMDLTGKQKADIKRQAYEAFPKNPELAEGREKELLEAERLKLAAYGMSEDEMLAEAHRRTMSERGAESLSTPQLARRRNEHLAKITEEQRGNVVRRYRLDGEGYHAAQKALAQEFPFFIRRTHFEPLDDWMARQRLTQPGDKPRPRPGKDMGYTGRGMLGPRDSGPQGRRSRDAGADTDAKGGPAGAAPKPDAPKGGSGGAANDYAKAIRERVLPDAVDVVEGSFGAVSLGIFKQPAVDTKSDADARTEGAEEWAVFMGATKSTRELTEFLLDPKTDVKHLDKAEQFLRVAESAVEDKDKAAYGRFAEAKELIATARMLRQPFAKPTGDPHLQRPETDRPAPPAFPEIEPLVGDKNGLAQYARANPDIAAAAKTLLAGSDADAVRAVGQAVEPLRKLEQWPMVEGKPDPTHSGDYDKAVAFHASPEARASMGEYQKAANLQRGWALARALRLTALARGEQDAGAYLADVGPKAPVAPSEPPPTQKAGTVGKAAIRVHGPGSAVAKAFAARQYRSALQGPGRR